MWIDRIKLSCTCNDTNFSGRLSSSFNVFNICQQLVEIESIASKTGSIIDGY